MNLTPTTGLQIPEDRTHDGTAYQPAQHDAAHGSHDAHGLGTVDTGLFEGWRESERCGWATSEGGGTGEYTEQGGHTECFGYAHAE
jgi:hypothetical protein